MRNSIISFVLMVLSSVLIAQAPQKMSYQSVVRNTSGVLFANQSVGVRISILEGTASGAVVYQETYSSNPQTNANGLITVEIGGGTPITGSFSSIDWESGPYFLKTETDPTGGTNYTIFGTSQLLSVPYALYTKTAGTANYNSLSNLPTLNITNWNTCYGWGNHAGLYRPIGWVPAWADVTGKPGFATVATSGSYNDLSDKPTIPGSQWTSSGSNIYYNTGDVGIGTTEPGTLLQVHSNTTYTNGITPIIRISDNLKAWNIGLGLTGDRFSIASDDYTERLTVLKSNGNVGIGPVSPQYKLDVAGNLNIINGIYGDALWCNGSQALWYNGTYFSWGYGGTYNYFARPITIGNVSNPTGYSLWVQGNAWSTGAFLSSDVRYKKNISTIENSLDKLMKIRGTSFEFRTDEFKDYQFAKGVQFGFIAQELEEVFPEVVKTEINGYKSVNYSSMIPVLLEAIKAQQNQIDELKKEITLLKSR
jgi:hypothetical protein